MLAFRRERRQIGERGPHVAEGALTSLQREVGTGRERLGSGGELGQPRKRLLTDARLPRLRFGTFRLLLTLLRRPLLLTPAILLELFLQPFPLTRLRLLALARRLLVPFGPRPRFRLEPRLLECTPRSFFRPILGLELRCALLSNLFGRIGHENRGRRRRGGRLPFVHLAEDGAGALEPVLVLPARGDMLEIATVVEPFDRGNRGVLEVAVQRDVDDFRAILDRRERRQPDRLERRVPGDGSQRMHVADAAEGAQGDFLAERRFRDRRQHSDVRQRFDRREALGFGQALERIERNIPQHRQRRVPNALISVRAGHRRQRGRIHQLPDRRPPDSGVRVFARDLRKQFALIYRDLLYVSQPDRGIGVLLGRLGAKSIQQSHIAAQA